MDIPFKEHVTNKEVKNKIRQAIETYEELLSRSSMRKHRIL